MKKSQRLNEQIIVERYRHVGRNVEEELDEEEEIEPQ